MTKNYPDVNPNPNFPDIEREVLAQWKNDKAFEKSVENRSGDEFVFYDGPPFANGLPHYGHLLTGFVKDVFARYQTMQGKRVERRFGWDCHGLPAEMGSEKELGISGRGAIQNYGIDKFNEHCRTSVMKYTTEWENYVTRQARWVDFKNDYKTMDKNFMESVLWAFKQLYDKGLVYEAHRVMPYSWAAETPLSNFETKLDNSYREREDKAITVAFELNEKPKCAPDAEKYYILAWTTTPWTLPSNLALGVSRKLYYAVINSSKYGNPTNYIVAEAFAPVWAELLDGKIIHTLSGSDLIDNPTSYHPLFPYFASHKHSFKILDGSSFVTDADGTGIVHLAPAFGEEDQKCCENAEPPIQLVCPVDGQGKYTDEIFDLPDLSLKGLNVIADKRKDETDPFNENQIEKFGLVNLRIIKWLKDNKKLIKEEQIKHNYPHCWRTDTPLIYRAMPSWYVEVTKFRDRAAELNQQINWIPAHIRDGQMGHMLKTAPDWSISRNRFWGTPIPVWRSKSGKIIVIGSIAELEKLSGEKVTDLHRPYIDNIKINKDGEEYTRVEDVFDCWFESGSMPFAQVHYPFENKQWFDEHFPADFITEYVGQTRGWFNTLIMLSTALFDKIPFKNCICHGVVLDAETGLKYSKRLKNYKDPMEVINQFGADALRWLMIASPVMRGQDLMVDPEGKFIRDVVRLAIKPIWNAYNFFTLYANADGIKAECGVWSVECGKENLHSTLNTQHSNIMDNYILAKMNQAVATIEQSMNAYDTPSACEAVLQFFDALNNWYIRRNKERFWKAEHDADKQAAYDTLYTVLVTMVKAVAPLLPLTCEEIYKGLTGGESVHLVDYPQSLENENDKELIEQMDLIRDICNAALSVRNSSNIRVRQPLNSITIVEKNKDLSGFEEIIKNEINVKEIKYRGITGNGNYEMKPNFPVLGKRVGEGIKLIKSALAKKEYSINKDFSVSVAGFTLQLGEYTSNIVPSEKTGTALFNNGQSYVYLDTTLDENLIAEGIARDVVRMVQQARKDAALNVSDKILLYIGAEDKIKAAVISHQAYIMEQTLTSKMLETAPDNAKYNIENKLDESNILISFVLSE